MVKTQRSWTLALTTCALLYAGCDRNRDRGEGRGELGAQGQGPVEPAPEPAMTPASRERADPPKERRAEADLEAAAGHDIDGEAKFYDTGSGVRIVAELEDAAPGSHGIHIHEKGDCSNIKGESMGAHFAPAGREHALPGETKARHLGDLGNIEVSKDGKGRLEITIQGANLKPGDENSFLGKAVVVHMSKDTGKSKQPSGGSGVPIACGVIEED